MRKFFNRATMLIVVALLAFTACSSDNPYYVPIDNGKTTSVLLRLDQETEFETRASVLCRETPVNLQLNTGDLYLVAPNGTIVEHFRIVVGGSPTPNTVTEIPATDHTIPRNYLRYGVRITGVPTSVRDGRVYLIGNPRVNNPTTGNISAVLNQPIVDMRHQRARNNQYGGGHLFGSAQLQRVTAAGVTPEVWAPPVCTVYNRRLLRLRSVVARIVIPDISALGKVESFSVEGVFIDNYYRFATVGGTPVPTSLRRNIADSRPFNNENLSGYPNAFQGYTWGWHSPAIACDLQTGVPITLPGGGTIFVDTRMVQLPMLGVYYQPWVFYVPAGTTPGRTPYLVFRLYDVVVAGETLPNPQFVVFNRFVGHSNPPPAFPGIIAGRNFRIAPNRLMFMEDDLRPTPTIITPTATTLSTRAIPIEIIE